MSVLVVDASVAVERAVDRGGDYGLGDWELVAPPLLWSESLSVLREMRYREEISRELAAQALTRLIDNTLSVEEQRPDALIQTAWDISHQLGWAKTYDAEYLALAKLRGTRVVTLDGRLRRGADRLGLVVTPEELRRERE